MKLRYRKRIKVMPGVTLNVSRSGVSTTYGIKGFSINKGKRGTYLNAGIPGSGIYSRTRLDTEGKTKVAPIEDVPIGSAALPSPPRPIRPASRWRRRVFRLVRGVLVTALALVMLAIALLLWAGP